MKHSQSQLVLRLAGRITAAALGLLVAVLVAIQFGRAIGENVRMARQLSSIRADVATLEKRRLQQRAEIARLRDPEGAVPEIHDRLRMVSKNETIIFVSPVPSPAQ
ncbi:MAG: septum formation initiator family protein [Candidatus Tumulicola sp.]